MGPLEGIRIIAWSTWQQGPAATAILGDFGAEVIKIEERTVGDYARTRTLSRGGSLQLPGGLNSYFEYCNHNKKGIAVDLKKPAGREIVYRLAAKSDVFVQNFRPGVATRLGIDYAALSKHNPMLIYANASGFGPEGPDRMRPGYDYIAQARSGIMYQTGDPDSPPAEIGWGLCDQVGSIMLAFGILAALTARDLHGVGQEIDGSLLGANVTLLALTIAHSSMTGVKYLRQRPGAHNPLFNHYRCKDDRWIALSHAAPDPYWEPLCKALGMPEMVHDPRFDTWQARKTNSSELIAILNKAFAARTYDEWQKTLDATGDFIYSKVQDVSDIPSDPQVIANQYIVDYDHPVLGKIKMPGLPIRFSKTQPSQVIRLPAPRLGEHTDEVLRELCGYGPDEIARLRAEEVI